MVDVIQWMNDHLYVPILVGIVILFLIIFLVVCCIRRRRERRYTYARLGEYDMAVNEKMQKDRQEKMNAVRDSAYMNCQFYLRSNTQYDNVQQLKELGSRIDKHWFRVTDRRYQSERILSFVPYNPKMMLPFTKSTQKTLKDLFSILQHPHIFPMCDFDFSLEQKLVISVQPVSIKGSLKDLIYQARFTDSFYEKYNRRYKGLELGQVQIFGKQVLEGLLFMYEKSFPQHGSVHSGNVMYDNGQCRLSGYENSFLGNSCRVHPLIKKKLKDNKEALDTLCFGHLLFEMCCGYELDSAHPEPQHLIGHQSPQIVSILNFIFGVDTGRYPSIKQIIEHGFFCNVRLNSLMTYNPAPIHLNQAMKSLLKVVRSGKSLKTRKQSESSRKKSISQVDSTGSSKTKEVISKQSSSSVPVAPPPPPPAAPAMSTPVNTSTNSSSTRMALLTDIQKGTGLKKTQTNDRSAPRV